MSGGGEAERNVQGEEGAGGGRPPEPRVSFLVNKSGAGWAVSREGQEGVGLPSGSAEAQTTELPAPSQPHLCV